MSSIGVTDPGQRKSTRCNSTRCFCSRCSGSEPCLKTRYELTRGLFRYTQDQSNRSARRPMSRRRYRLGRQRTRQEVRLRRRYPDKMADEPLVDGGHATCEDEQWPSEWPRAAHETIYCRKTSVQSYKGVDHKFFTPSSHPA